MQLTVERAPLRVVFVLIGAALALALALVDTTVVALLHQETRLPLWAVVGLGAGLVVLPPVLLGLLPAMRTVEGVAATSLLGVDVPGAGEPARTASQRGRTLGWFLAHLLAGAAIAAGVTAALVVGGWWAVPVLGGTVLLAVALGTGLAALAPRLLGPSYAERIALLERDVDRAVERNRLAREIHDGVGHALSLVSVQAGAARRVLATDPAFARDALEAIEDAARRATADLDRVLGLLRDSAAPRPQAADLTTLEELVGATRTAGLEVDHRTGGDLSALPSVVSREGYRVAQESLTNALRWSGDGTATLEVVHDRGVLRISSANPLGADQATSRSRGGRGLVGLRERVAALGGALEAGVVGDRWQLVATIPTTDPSEPTR
ncbi:sensor histidine kinase [Nocardioides sp. SYSU DS0651]|uniref:sensor histidine kinase n=1 Tax=Nocardioides sp. SYSU DS0651 TaxID=3415955 RepID=UPI003F4B878C